MHVGTDYVLMILVIDIGNCFSPGLLIRSLPPSLRREVLPGRCPPPLSREALGAESLLELDGNGGCNGIFPFNGGRTFN